MASIAFWSKIDGRRYRGEETLVSPAPVCVPPCIVIVAHQESLVHVLAVMLKPDSGRVRLPSVFFLMTGELQGIVFDAISSEVFDADHLPIEWTLFGTRVLRCEVSICPLSPARRCLL